MSDAVYIVDNKANNLRKVSSISLRDVGTKERSELQEWVVSNPEVLGEQLLVGTTEFSHFDRSNRRLDILALDSRPNLVVIELKLDVKSSLADLQAIRYAAFAQGMTMDEFIVLHAAFLGCSEEEASDHVKEFLQVEELPELVGQPRIILAAGSMDDQELTSCVLWLRQFGVDITCVELTPYRLGDSEPLLLVPRVIIPLPETRDYQVRLEQKESIRIREASEHSAHASLWRTVAEAFNSLETGRKVTSRSPNSPYLKLSSGLRDIHYEWVVRKREQRLDVAPHFESDDADENMRGIKAIIAHEDEIRKGIDAEYQAGPWGRRWAQAMFRLPYDGSAPTQELVAEATTIMRSLVERTQPLLKTGNRA